MAIFDVRLRYLRVESQDLHSDAMTTGLARLALDLENVAAAACLAAIDVVKDPAGVKTAATIEPVELQHAAILNFLLGQYPVPDSCSKKSGARPASDTIG